MRLQTNLMATKESKKLLDGLRHFTPQLHDDSSISNGLDLSPSAWQLLNLLTFVDRIDPLDATQREADSRNRWFAGVILGPTRLLSVMSDALMSFRNVGSVSHQTDQYMGIIARPRMGSVVDQCRSLTS